MLAIFSTKKRETKIYLKVDETVDESIAMLVPACQYRYASFTTMILILPETVEVLDGVS